jgi:hypothetical protein
MNEPVFTKAPTIQGFDWILETNGQAKWYLHGEPYDLVRHIHKNKFSTVIITLAVSDTIRAAWNYKYPGQRWSTKEIKPSK